MEIPDIQPADIDQAAEGLQHIVMDDLAELVWDEVSCARVLMNLSDRLELMADRLLDISKEKRR